MPENCRFMTYFGGILMLCVILCPFWNTILREGLSAKMEELFLVTLALRILKLTVKMIDSKFTCTGFKYPERIFGLKHQGTACEKPTLLSQTFGGVNKSVDYPTRNSMKQLRYSKFGTNLGPSRAVIPNGKFVRKQSEQSSVINYRRSEAIPAKLNCTTVPTPTRSSMTPMPTVSPIF